MDKIKCDECGEEFEGVNTDTLCEDCAFAADDRQDFEEDGDDE